MTELPFEANRGVHTVLGRVNGRDFARLSAKHAGDRLRRPRNMLSVKGAPEAVLSGCVRWRPDDETVEFDRAAMAEVEDHVNELAARGFRVMAVAERAASERTDIDTERLHDLDPA